MDVDLLRPGTVPLSPDTILWFEFLLDQKLLKKHLSDPNSEPTATELILEFLSVDTSCVQWKPNNDRVAEYEGPPTPPDSVSPVGFNLTRKQLALKILALKIASTLNWNLDTFESKLPSLIQKQLVQDFVYMASDGTFTVPPLDMPWELSQRLEMQFALTLYHRWVLRFPVKTALHNKSSKLPFMPMNGLPLENGYSHINNYDKILRINETSRMQSIRYLNEMVCRYEPAGATRRREPRLVKVPVMEAFVHLTEDSDIMDHDWDAGDVYITHYELLMQIHFDLCYNYFFYGQHDLAKKHILGCRENLTLLENEVARHGYGPHKTVPWGQFNYASMSKEDIFGYIRALNLGYELLNEPPSLLQRLQESVTNHYTGIIAVLQADNLAREIPMIHRQVVELDIQGSASSGAFTVARDLLIRVSALNAVRYALEGGLPSTHPDYLNKFKSVGTKFFELLFWALAPVLMSNLSEEDWDRLRMFFLHLATSSQCKLPIDKIDEYLERHVGKAAGVIREKLICDEHLQVILNDQMDCDEKNMDLPPELLTDDWETPQFEYKTVPELEMGRLKKRLMDAATADDVRMCLVKLAVMCPSTPLWKLCGYWWPLGNAGVALAALPRGFLQDFGFVVSSAARARAEAGGARAALGLLSVLEGEARSQLGAGSDPKLYRLCRLLAWELLLLQINLMLSEWPHHHINVTLIVSKCKACIAAANAHEGVHPRPQVVHAAWMCLLNIGEWESGAAPTGPGELAAALSAACAELQRGKAGRKFPRTLWDYILSSLNSGMNGPLRKGMYSNNHAYHNSHHNNHTNHSNHHGQLEGRGAYHALLQALREPLAITVVLSVLAKIYNILIDDSSLELVIEYTNLWPNMITNGNAYNTKYILESITELLERGLNMYPYNTSWLRLYGDVEVAAGRHGPALRRYLCALAAGSWHFAKRAPDEGSVARRAARCCQALGAPTQAAALSQLPDEPDYTAAFKCLAEKTGNAADSMDAYYGCLWDGTLLEVAVALHARRGEGGRRARAVTAAGALELNANNSEDIQREAAAIRRARLLRALTNQEGLCCMPAVVIHNSHPSSQKFGKSFRQLSYLVRPKLQHKKDEPKKAENSDKSIFSCDTCKKEFRKLQHFVQHRLIHNSAPLRPSRKASSEQKEVQKNQDNKAEQSAGFRCEPCD